jgi:hypothetical protein
MVCLCFCSCNHCFKPTSLIRRKLSAAGIHSATFLLRKIAQLKISLHSAHVSNPCFFSQQFQILHHTCCSPTLQPRHLLGACDWYLLQSPQYNPQQPMSFFASLSFTRSCPLFPLQYKSPAAFLFLFIRQPESPDHSQDHKYRSY